MISKNTLLQNFMIPLILILIYLSIELIQINLGGLFFDDAIDGALAVQILKNDIGNDGIRVFNRNLPLMLSNSHAAFTSYLILPIFYFFGINALLLRLFTVTSGALTLLLMYFFVGKFLNNKTAVIVTLLLAVHCTFITETRFGLSNGSILSTIMMCSLFCFLTWYLGKNNLYFYVGTFLLGIGLSVRIWFAWFIGAFCVCGVIFWKEVMSRLKYKGNFYVKIYFGLLTFIAGSFLLFYNNVTRNFSTFKFLFKNFQRTAEEKVNNLDYIHNLFVRFGHIFDHLTSRKWFWVSEYYNYLYAVFFLLPIAFIFYILMSRRKSYFSKKRILFVIILVFAVLFESPFTPTALRDGNIFWLFPLLILLFCIGIIECNFYFKNRFITTLIVLFFLLLLFTELYKNFKGYIFFRETGGRGYQSDAVNVLAKWLMEKDDYKKIVIVSGKLYHSLTVLTGGKLYEKITDFTYGCHCYESNMGMPAEEKEKFFLEIERMIKGENNLFLEVVQPEHKYWTCDRIITQIMKKNKLKISQEKYFYQKNDKSAIFRAFTIR